MTLLTTHMLFGSFGLAIAEDAPKQAENQKTEAQKAEEILKRGDQFDTNAQFKVADYLTAKDQGQAYLKSKAPIASFIIQIINFLVLMIGSLCFLTILIGGFIYMVSHGNETMINKAKEAITYSVIGLVAALSAYFIVAYVQSIFYEL